MNIETIIRALVERDYITDYASEYGEPGYRDDSGPVLLGTYWCHDTDCNYQDRYDNGRRKVHGLEIHYPHVFAKLEEAGCQLEWCDEWTVIDDKAYRTAADSYSWQPTAVWNDDIGDYMLNGEDLDTWEEWAANQPSRCLMRDSFTDAELADAGWTERRCDYESGWFEGMNDDPKKIFDAIRERESDTDVLFMLSETSQFYVRFCVYVRDREEQ